ncbi:MAG: hypothetical protein KJ622_05490 [Alphaproteobacteria bacterium]|nr:hypothetical protein [Alphaproteobacteria bacterium]
MTAGRLPEEDVTPNPQEVEFMAATLESRHGMLAAQIADFFSTLHGHNGDAGRSWAWAGVAQLVRKRERERQNTHF